jgi:HD-like signal output (HDOD) protein
VNRSVTVVSRAASGESATVVMAAAVARDVRDGGEGRRAPGCLDSLIMADRLTATAAAAKRHSPPLAGPAGCVRMRGVPVTPLPHESPTMPVDLDALVAATPELAAMPATSARLLDLLEDPDAPVDAILSVIEADTGLTANLLRLANSAYYGQGRGVGGVREALVMLGNEAVVSMAFAASMGRLLQAPVSGYRLPRGQLWRHSLACGLMASRLAPAQWSSSRRYRLFAAGVLHDLGKLILDAPLRSSLEALPPDLAVAVLPVAERRLLGCDHAAAGAALAAAWRFPADLVAVIGGHHDPDAQGDAALVAAADLLVTVAGCGGGPVRADEDVADDLLAAAGVPADGAVQARRQTLADLDALLALLGVSS